MLSAEKQIEDNRQQDTDKNHGSDWNKDESIITLNADITRQAAKPFEKTRCIRGDQADDDQDNACTDDNFTHGKGNQGSRTETRSLTLNPWSLIRLFDNP